jgi:hypothetical protein
VGDRLGLTLESLPASTSVRAGSDIVIQATYTPQREVTGGVAVARVSEAGGRMEFRLAL